jgi:hypothetical protein
MSLPSSGAISLNQMHVEVGGSSGSTASLNDSDIRGLISKSSGATMAFNEWYGASSEVDTITLNSAYYQDSDKYNSYRYGVRTVYNPNLGSWVDATLETTGGTEHTLIGIETGNSDIGVATAWIYVSGNLTGGSNTTTFANAFGYNTVRSSNGSTTYMTNNPSNGYGNHDNTNNITSFSLTFNNYLPTGNNLKLKFYT